MMNKSPYVTYEIKNHILYGKYLPTNISLDVAQGAVAFRKQITKDNSYVNLVDCTNVSKFEKQARDYLSSGEATKGVLAGAILINSSFQAAIANFFIKVTNPKIPTKIFTSEEKAIEWIQQFIK